MKQIQLMLTCESLQPGEAIKIAKQDMYDCARDDLSSLLFCSLSKSDVKDFIKKIESNCDIKVTENPIDNSYTLYKRLEPEDEDKEIWTAKPWMFK